MMTKCDQFGYVMKLSRSLLGKNLLIQCCVFQSFVKKEHVNVTLRMRCKLEFDLKSSDFDKKVDS